MIGDGSGFDRLYETARALGEETRFAVYRQLCLSDEPVPVSALAERFSLHPNAIRPHLSRLEQAGLVVSRTERTTAGVGRPRRLYEPSREPVELTYPPLATRALVALLAEAVDALPADRDRLAQIGEGWGRAWAARRKRENGSVPRSRRGRADLLVGELTEWGWRPKVDRAPREVRLRNGRCLFEDSPPGGTTCALEEGLLRGIVTTLCNGHARVETGPGCRLEVTL